MGVVVSGLAVVGAVIAATLLTSAAGSAHRSGSSSTPSSSVSPVRIEAITVYMANQRPPDNPQNTKLTFDGDPATYWSTDIYPNQRFGNLYPGIGLEIQLGVAERGRHLTVTSPLGGWSAATYVSSSSIPSGQAVSAWASPTDAKSNIAPGTVSFSLGDRRAQWVLLWITSLAPSNQARIAELAVS